MGSMTDEDFNSILLGFLRYVPYLKGRKKRFIDSLPSSGIIQGQD